VLQVLAESGLIGAAGVRTPEGRLFVIKMTDSNSTVYERDSLEP